MKVITVLKYILHYECPEGITAHSALKQNSHPQESEPFNRLSTTDVSNLCTVTRDVSSRMHGQMPL